MESQDMFCVGAIVSLDILNHSGMQRGTIKQIHTAGILVEERGQCYYFYPWPSIRKLRIVDKREYELNT